MLRIGKLIVPVLLAFGVAGFATESFADAAKHKEKTHSSKSVKKKDKAEKKKSTKKKPEHKQSSNKVKKPKTKAQGAHAHEKKKKATKHTSSDHKKPAPQKTQKAHHKEQRAPSQDDSFHAQDKVVGHRADGRAIYRGPRGGRYYINDAGNKVYLPR